MISLLVPGLFLIGLLVGSFLNVVLSRLDTDESFVTGRSRCDACGATIRWYDNVPLVSFLALRGRCRACARRISWRHPAVELSVAVLFALTGYFLPMPHTVVSALGMTLALGLIGSLTVVFVHDLDRMEIPVSALGFAIVWTLCSLTLSWLFSRPPVTFMESGLFEGLVGGAVAFGLFYGLVFFSRESWMGMGDAWLALVLGLAVGWKLLLPTLTIAFGSGAIVGIVLIMLGRKELSSRMPFAPFLAASVIFTLFFGTMIGRMFEGLTL